jgi:hypothetical protein
MQKEVVENIVTATAVPYRKVSVDVPENTFMWKSLTDPGTIIDEIILRRKNVNKVVGEEQSKRLVLSHFGSDNPEPGHSWEATYNYWVNNPTRAPPLRRFVMEPNEKVNDTAYLTRLAAQVGVNTSGIHLMNFNQKKFAGHMKEWVDRTNASVNHAYNDMAATVCTIEDKANFTVDRVGALEERVGALQALVKKQEEKIEELSVDDFDIKLKMSELEEKFDQISRYRDFFNAIMDRYDALENADARKKKRNREHAQQQRDKKRAEQGKEKKVAPNVDEFGGLLPLTGAVDPDYQLGEEVQKKRGRPRKVYNNGMPRKSPSKKKSKYDIIEDKSPKYSPSPSPPPSSSDVEITEDEALEILATMERHM